MPDDTPKFADEDRIDSLFAEKNGTYKTQLDEAAETDKGGEFRGYYPETWKPRSSQHRGRAGGAHNGVDIYTGYAPFPLETPILSATDGWFSPLIDASSPNAAGNRAAIQTKIGTQVINFRYGHFTRFARGAGKVKKGDLIGYAGCSGNADTAGECSEPGPCGLTSCHVHLITALGSNYSNTPDPVAMLGWKLKYGAKNEPERKCADVKPEAQPFVPDRASGSLALTKNYAHPRSKKGRRRNVPAPFSDIVFDDTQMLREAQAAYENLGLRMKGEKDVNGVKIKITAHSKKKIEFGDDLKAEMRDTWLGTLKHARNDPKTVQGRALAVLDEEIALLTANTDKLGLGGATTRALLAAARALWLLTGGAALRRGMSNRTLYDLWETSGYDKFSQRYATVRRNLNPLVDFTKMTVRRMKKGKEMRKTVTMTPPQCGLGVHGSALLVASDHARAAYHFTGLELDTNIDGVEVKGQQVAISLDFGTVGLMQGIWPLSMGAVVGDIAEAKAFCERVAQCLMRFMISYNKAVMSSAALSLTDPNDPRRVKAAKDLADELGDMRKDIAETFDSFLSLDGLDKAATKIRQTQVETLLSRLVAYNTALTIAAKDYSSKSEKTTLIAPRMTLMHLGTGKQGEG